MARLHNAKGVTITELLAALAILGIMLIVAIPAMGEWVRKARVRSAADEMTVGLRATRYIAVANRTSSDFTINVDPLNYFSYSDVNGREVRVEMPVGVRLVSTTANPITFNLNGGISGGEQTIVIETKVAGDLTHRYTITVSSIGKIAVDFISIST